MDEAGFLALQLALSDIIANQIHDRELAPMSYGPNKGKPIHIPGKESFKAISEAQGKPPREALERVIREEFSRACGRPITEDEFPKYFTFMERNLAQGGNEAGLKTTLLGIYLSSEAVYRIELGRGDGAALWSDKHSWRGAPRHSRYCSGERPRARTDRAAIVTASGCS